MRWWEIHTDCYDDSEEHLDKTDNNNCAARALVSEFEKLQQKKYHGSKLHAEHAQVKHSVGQRMLIGLLGFLAKFAQIYSPRSQYNTTEKEICIKFQTFNLFMSN